MNTITTLNDIKLYQWIELQEYLETNPPEDKVAFQTISILYEISTEEARKIDYNELEYLLSKVNEILQEKPKFEPLITLNEVQYGFIPNLDKITAGEFVDLETFQNEFRDKKINLWKIMSLLYRPVIETESFGHYKIEPYSGEVDERFREMPIGVALGAHLFFCDLGNDLLTHIQNYLEPKKNEKVERKQPKLRGGLKEAFMLLTKSGVGLDGLLDFVMMTLSNLSEFRNSMFIKPLSLQVIELTIKNSKKASTKVNSKKLNTNGYN